MRWNDPAPSATAAVLLHASQKDTRHMTMISTSLLVVCIALCIQLCAGFKLRMGSYSGVAKPPAVFPRNASPNTRNREPEIGGIYQYQGIATGNKPPPELLELIGFPMQTKSSRSTKDTNKNVQPGVHRLRPASVATLDDVDLDALEREVGRKYSSKSFRVSDKLFEESDTEDTSAEATQARRFARGNTRSPNNEPQNGPKFWETKVRRSKPESSLQEKFHGRDSRWKGAETSAVAKSPEVDSAPASFRLRPPPPLTAEMVQLAAHRAAQIKQREQQQERQRAELKEKNKKLFVPFHFETDVTDSTTADTMSFLADQTFESLGITNPSILENLAKMGLGTATHIQALAIPALLRHESVVVQAQTGSGKTLAYLLPLISAVDPRKREVQALILAPSRELVQQIGQVASALFAGTDWRVQTLIGGANVDGQVKRMRDDKPQILVATPGRLGEIVFHLEKLRLGAVRAVVVDEVDNMMQAPYVGDLEAVLQATPLYRARRRTGLAGSVSVDAGQRHVDADSSSNSRGISDGVDQQDIRMICLASATSNDSAVNAFADTYAGAGHWRTLSVDGDSAIPAGITHGLISCPKERSLGLLKRFLNAKPAVHSALIFVNDPKRVMGVCRELELAGIVAAPLHGDTNKDDRKEILARIKDGRLSFVVATELAARGLDIPDLTHVVNFELPTDPQHYVHRTGRCGRAGRKGLVMNFANPETKFVVRRFGKKLGVRIQDCEVRDGRVFLKGE